MNARDLDDAIDRLIQVVLSPPPHIKGGNDFKTTDIRLARAEIHRVASQQAAP
jgi:hypothetical protein